MRERGAAQQVVCGVLILGAALLLGPSAGTLSSSSPPDFRIAFIADQGDGADADAVLSLIASEQADAVLHSGDFDYSDDPLGWDTRITSHLGPDFPYFASVGNHDEREYYGAGGYQEFLEARMNRLGIAWQGDLGVQSSFEYAGIFFVLTAPGSFGEGDGYHDLYIRDQLAANDSVWRLSSFHKNMKAMQVGGKNDSTGWGVYEESRRGGAIIATGHEHVYARTHLLSNTETQTVASSDNTLVLSRDDPASPEDEGRSFVFVSGIGGSSVRDQERCLPTTPPYGCQGEWASIYARQQGAQPGALFGVFNHQGNPDLAYFYFKDVDGNVVDSFFVESRLGPPGPPPVAANDGPYLVAAGETFSQDAPGVLANDGDSLTAILENDVSSGTLSLAADGSFTYTHDGSATRSDGFRYRASNGVRESNLATASIAVLPAQGATLEVPGDFASIQAAHDAAQSGDLILLAPGTYRENLTLSKAITLGSWFVTTGDPAYVDTTIVDGDGGAAVIVIPAAAEEGIAIVGLTIQNADDGIFPRARFDLIHNRIRFTTDGADYEAGSGGTCRYNVFEDNSDDGVDLDGAVDIVVEFNTIRNNRGDGMEIRLQPYTGPTLDYVIRNNLIHGNQEDGIQLIDYDTLTDRRFEISGNAIYDNVQAGLGLMSGANTVENFEGASIQEPIRLIGNTFLRNGHGMTGGDSAVVLNNLFVGHAAIALKNVDGDSLAAFNLFHDNGTDATGSNLDATTTFSGDPLLDEALVPAQASPAIDAGTDFFVWQEETVLDLAPSEYLGFAPDLGAFEAVLGAGGVPKAPTPVEPPDGAVDVALTPTLRWLGTADFYQLQVATSEDFATASTLHDVVTSDASREHLLGAGVLAHAATYHWRVRGSDAGGMGPWSSVWTFTTRTATSPPEAPLLWSPLHGAGNVELSPELAWLGSADGFRVQIALDPGFTAPLVDASVSTKSLTLAPGAYSTTYYWRVLGVNAVGVGPWSATSAFTTLPPLLPPTPPSNLRSPAQAETSIDLVWDASGDPNATAYRIYRDGLPIASESEPSHQAVGLSQNQLYHFEVTALDASGRESLRTGELGVWTTVESASLSVAIPVSAGRDDAEERISSGGSVNLTSGDLELTEDLARLQAVGIRFRGVDVPQGATIRGARIQFTVDETGSKATSLTIEGEASDDAAVFAASDHNVTSRPKTGTSVAWTPPPWTSTRAAGPDQRTPDLTEIVQEIVDRPGWSTGNALAVVISGSGHRTAEAYDGSSTRAAVLEVNYARACPADADGDGFDCAADCDDGDAAVHPAAAELCDGLDNDCDYNVDEGDAVDAVLWFADFDGDGYGDPNHTTSACAEPPGWVADASDCNDADASVFPGAGEICDDGLDNDCDGATDSSDESDCVPISHSVAVGAGKDDAEERIASGRVNLDSADLELSEDQDLLQAVGVRFRDVDVPRNATIRGARIQFTVDETGSVETSLTIEGEASDDAPAFSKSDYDVTSRPKTSHSVAWDPPPWTSTGAAGSDQRTPELTEVVQEIVDRPGWSSGNSLAVVISGSGHRTAEAYDGDRKKAARLEVEYLCEVDADGDGFACQVDCDDGDPSIHPGAAELCDGRDNDCDAEVDEGDAINAAIWFADGDGDGYGDPTRTANACAQPPGWVADASDCDDLHDTVHPGAWDVCDGLDNDCDGTAIDEDFQPQSTSCGVGACVATGVLGCIAGTLVDSCQPNSPAAADTSCNAVDDDCDGSTDEDYLAPATQCGVGACGASGALECIAGAQVDSCQPGAPAPTDATCDALDDDCDGSADEDYLAPATQCGVGACGASGALECIAGALVDSCQPGDPAPADATCDALDDDCDGSADEDYLAPATQCGVGACGASGALECIAGAQVDSCQPNAPAPADATCDALDDDCDGSADEDYLAPTTQCGVGVCGANGALECIAGTLVDSCQPGAPAADDGFCNGLDDDCDGAVDEDFSSQGTECGVGACGAVGSTSCVAGTLVDSCQPGAPAPADATCDAVDDDCDGSTDEDYLGPATQCGVGACGASGALECVAGTVVDGCEPGAPAPADATCDLVDDDCDGSADEDYLAPTTQCGVGACGANGVLECVAGATVDRCEPGIPAASDATCDLVDDDCDGSTDEDYLAPPTQCGVGACGASGALECIAGATVDSCEPGAPAAIDATCDAVDDDCDGSADEDYLAPATQCGVGACGASGALECIAGATVNSCEPGAPAAIDATCDAVDDDCDGGVDEDYLAPLTQCGVGACGASGALECVAGGLVDSCRPGAPAAIDATCDAVDDDCDGSADEDYLAPVTRCGVGACGASGVLACVSGALIDSCQPGPPAAADAACNAADDDCDGSVDEDFTPQSCLTGQLGVCSAGSTSCQAGTELCLADVMPLANDAICNALDDDCDGAVDEDFGSQSCATEEPGICAAGATLCQSGAELCVADQSPVAEICGDGLDNDCDGSADFPSDPDCEAPPPQSLRLQVSASEDDAEERVSSGGGVSRLSRDLDMTEDAGAEELQAVGVRFRDVGVPRDATILGARLRFTVDHADDVATSLIIEGEASDDAAGFLRSQGNVTSRPRTSTAVGWDPPAWKNNGTSGADQTSPDLSALIQEIVDRTGWSAGNSMAFIISGSGQRVAESYDGMPSHAAVLEVEYSEICLADADGDGFICEVDCDDEDPSVHPNASEACDGRDNDCDGQADEAVAPQSCATGALGVCAAGTTSCQAGDEVCVADREPEPEICGDGLDNDCNGVTDCPTNY